MKYKVIALLLILNSMMVGCSNNNHTSDNTINLKYEKEYTDNLNDKFQTSKFSFVGQKVKINNSNVPLKVEGVISIPVGAKEKLPVVFIIHGRHSDKNDTEFEDGFKYLTEELAKNGIIGISVDTSMNYTWEFGEVPENHNISNIIQSHIDSLKKANKSTKNVYGIDLKGKLDLSKIGLIGHSVGGSGVIKIANDQILKGNDSIKGIIAVTPSYNTPIKNFPDIKTAIIVSEYDGDVIHAGADLYEEIIKNDKDRKNPVGLTYLIGGNHNSFNSYLGEKEFSSPQDTNGKYPEKLGRKEQRDFLKSYSVDYMKSVFEFENSKSPIFNSEETLPNKMYGYSTMNKVYHPNSDILFDKKQFKNIEYRDIITEELIESSIDNDSTKFFSVLEFTTGIDLLRIDWSKLGGFIDLPLNNNHLSKYKEIAIEWALNSSSELNSKGEPVKFDLMLESSNGNKVIVPISGDKFSSMKYIDGVPLKSEYLEGEYLEYWSRKTPVSTFTIPLEKIKEHNLKDISKIKLEFNSSEKGSIFIKNIIGIEH